MFDGQSRPTELRAALEELAAEYEGRGIAIKETGTVFRVQVRSEFADEVSRLWPDRPPQAIRVRCSRRSP